MGLYERLLQEAAQLPEDPNRERNGRMAAYLRNLRGPVPEGGGYVTTEELEQEQERYLTILWFAPTKFVRSSTPRDDVRGIFSGAK